MSVKAYRARRSRSLRTAFLARHRIVRAREAERLLYSAPFFGPASPAAATFAPPAHDPVRILQVLGVRQDAVPERRFFDRAAGAAELPEDFWRFSKPDDEEIDVDRFQHASHSFQHSGRLERLA